jgi:hypothetical protein
MFVSRDALTSDTAGDDDVEAHELSTAVTKIPKINNIDF